MKVVEGGTDRWRDGGRIDWRVVATHTSCQAGYRFWSRCPLQHWHRPTSRPAPWSGPPLCPPPRHGGRGASSGALGSWHRPPHTKSQQPITTAEQTHTLSTPGALSCSPSEEHQELLLNIKTHQLTIVNYEFIIN